MSNIFTNKFIDRHVSFNKIKRKIYICKGFFKVNMKLYEPFREKKTITLFLDEYVRGKYVGRRMVIISKKNTLYDEVDKLYYNIDYKLLFMLDGEFNLIAFHNYNEKGEPPSTIPYDIYHRPSRYYRYFWRKPSLYYVDEYKCWIDYANFEQTNRNANSLKLLKHAIKKQDAIDYYDTYEKNSSDQVRINPKTNKEQAILIDEEVYKKASL